MLVDEYQDTNHVQYLLLKNLVTPEHSLTVVGDDDQSIYSVGAVLTSATSCASSATSWGPLGAARAKLPLDANHRVWPPTAVISHNTARKGKTLFTEG